MLMITVETEADFVTLRLDGRLAGPEARELSRNWDASSFKQPHQRVVFDLTGVTGVDDVGIEFLAQAYRNGDALVGGRSNRAIVEAIAARSAIENGLDGSGASRDRLSGRRHAILGT
jgi:hypothetical protein